MEITLEATSREKTGSGESRRLRSSGLIPAVMYGLGTEPQSLLLNSREFNNALKTEAGSNVILNVNVGKDSFPALAREIQRHAYKDEIVHVDLVRIDLSQTVEADVQVNFIGTPLGVKEEGGVVQTVNNTISITALPTNIPSSLDVDISPLNVGDNVTATDIQLPEGVVLASEDDDSILVTITIPRAVIEEEEVVDEELEGEEGEEEAGEGDEESEDASVARGYLSDLETSVINLGILTDGYDKFMEEAEKGLAFLENAYEQKLWLIDFQDIADSTFDGDYDKATRAVGIFNAYCARCHTAGYSAGAAYTKTIGSGGLGPALKGGRVNIQFKERDDFIDFIINGSVNGKGYGVNGVGGGKMPGFGAVLPQSDIELVIDYLRGMTPDA